MSSNRLTKKEYKSLVPSSKEIGVEEAFGKYVEAVTGEQNDPSLKEKQYVPSNPGTFKDKKGREFEYSVSGEQDDVQIDEANYTDDGSEVPDEVIEGLQDSMQDGMFEAWEEQKRGEADALYDQMKEEGYQPSEKK